VELLANQIVTDLCTDAERSTVTLSPEAIARLCDLSWNKNITELHAFLENAMANVTNDVMDVASFEASEKREVTFGGEIDEEGFKLMSLRKLKNYLSKRRLCTQLRIELKPQKFLEYRSELLEIKLTNIEMKDHNIL